MVVVVSLSAQTLTCPREQSEVFVDIQYMYIIISTLLSYPLTNMSAAVTFQAASTHRYMASSPVSTTPENLLGREHGNRQCFFTLLHARSIGCFMQHCELMNTMYFLCFHTSSNYFLIPAVNIECPKEKILLFVYSSHWRYP